MGRIKATQSNIKTAIAAAFLSLLACLGRAEFADQACELIAERNDLDPGFLLVVHEGQSIYPLIDQATYDYKIMHAEDGRLWQASFDTQGNPVMPEELETMEHQAHEQTYGNFDPALQEMVDQSAPQEWIAVILWMKEEGYQQPDLQELMDREPDEETIEEIHRVLGEAREAFVNDLCTPLHDELLSMGIDNQILGFSPAIAAEIPVYLLLEMRSWSDIDRIYLDGETVPTLENARKAIYADRINGIDVNGHPWGNTGCGVKVGIIESGGRAFASINPYIKPYYQDTTHVCSEASDHAAHVLGIIASRHADHTGIAPQSYMWVGGHCAGTGKNHKHLASDSKLILQANAAYKYGVSVSNLSLGEEIPTGTFSALARHLDDMTYRMRQTFVISAGNEGDTAEYVGSPGTAYNAITVGSYDDKNTRTGSDDSMAIDSGFRNPKTRHNDNHKPDVVAPGVAIRSTINSTPFIGSMSGTSMAAPMVAGTVSLAMKNAGSFKYLPEATKALIMATAIHNKEGASARSDRDGAGGIDTEEAVDVAAEMGSAFGQIWHTTSFDCASGRNQFPIQTTQDLNAGIRTRIAIAWSTNAQYRDYANAPSIDLDLAVYDPSGNYVTGSWSWDSTSEIVDFWPTQSGTYTIKIKSFRCSEYFDPPKIGFAVWK